MKVHIVKDVYISPSGNHIKTNILEVFSTLKLLIVYLNEHRENWEPKYKEGNIVYANYFDLETFYTSDDSELLYYILYRNGLGYYNNPVVFKDESEAKIKEQELKKKGRECVLKTIEIK